MAEESGPLGRMSKQKKTLLLAGGGVLAFGGFLLLRRKSSASSSANLIASPTGQIPVFGGSAGGGGETLFLPGSQGGAGATQIGESGVTTPAPMSLATQLGFTNPNTPVQLVGGSLIDTGTGRVAYYGPNGQPGSASNFSGATSWTDPTGKQVYYNPNSYQYSDTTRAPDTPPLHALAG